MSHSWVRSKHHHTFLLISTLEVIQSDYYDVNTADINKLFKHDNKQLKIIERKIMTYMQIRMTPIHKIQ